MTIKFNSKLLLFGEYGIIKGSMGLAYPLQKYFGYLKFSNQNISEDLRLNEFLNYLSGSSLFNQELDLKKFEEDIAKGLFFDSNIPIGHGIGSSGALCASIFSHYSKHFERKKNYSQSELKYLKDLMALMESYYHGSSSGVDCLISLIDRPLMIKGRNEIELINVNGIQKLGHFYLYESNLRRKTSPLVHAFLEDYETDELFQSDVHQYMELSDLLIRDFIELDKESFKMRMEKLTKLQYFTFKKMIPRHVEKIWIDSIESKKYSVKLCGAGGGGFYLIYSPDEKIIHPNFIEVKL